MKRDRPPDLKTKGHRESIECLLYICFFFSLKVVLWLKINFNGEVEDKLDAASKRLKRIAPSDANKKLVQEAIDELQEGMDAISEKAEAYLHSWFI